LHGSLSQDTFSGRSSGSDSLTMKLLIDRFGEEGAQVKADWCIQMGLVTKDPQNTEDKRLWLYEVPTGPKSSSGWQASSVQEMCGDHAQPQLLIGDASSRDAGVSSTATVPKAKAKAKAKGKAKAKAKARPTCAADRILKLRLQIDKEIEAMRNMVKEVSVDPMAKDMAEWMQKYVTEMENIKGRKLDDEASAVLHRIALFPVCSPVALRRRDCLTVPRLTGRTEGSPGDDGNGGISAEPKSVVGLSYPRESGTKGAEDTGGSLTSTQRADSRGGRARAYGRSS
jgi:hypothetical protein